MDKINDNVTSTIVEYLKSDELKIFSLTNKYYRQYFYDKFCVNISKCKAYNMLKYSLEHIKYIAIKRDNHFKKNDINNHDMTSNINKLNNISKFKYIRNI